MNNKITLSLIFLTVLLLGCESDIVVEESPSDILPEDPMQEEVPVETQAEQGDSVIKKEEKVEEIDDEIEEYVEDEDIIEEEVEEQAEDDTEEEPEEPTEIKIKVELRLPDSLKVGEHLNAGYTINNDGGKLFKAYSTLKFKKEGESDLYSCRIKVSYPIEQGFGNILYAIQRDYGFTSCIVKNFSSSGNYIYEVNVYDCADIEAEFEKNCFEVDENQVNTKITPIETAIKTISIVE